MFTYSWVRLQPHAVAVSLNGSALGTLTFFGQAQGRGTFPIPASLLREGVNTVRLAGSAELDINSIGQERKRIVTRSRR